MFFLVVIVRSDMCVLLYFCGLCVLCFCILVVKDSAWPKVNSIRVEKKRKALLLFLSQVGVSPKEAEDCTQHRILSGWIFEILSCFVRFVLQDHRFEKSQEHNLDCEFSFLNRIQY